LAGLCADDPQRAGEGRKRHLLGVAASEAALAVAGRTVAVGNAIPHIEAARDAADREANPPKPAVAEAELRRNELGVHLSLTYRRAMVSVWTA
jgi:hypothetical protein